MGQGVALGVPHCLCRDVYCLFNPLNAELNPICHLLALIGGQHILHVSRVRAKNAVTT